MELLGKDAVASSINDDFLLEGVRVVIEQDVLDHLRGVVPEDDEKWIDGVDCRILKPGGQWQRARVRIAVVFESA